MRAIGDIVNRFRNGQRTRVLAFGSSNTEHIAVGMHWFECLDYAIGRTFGRVHTFINTGIGGDTAAGLLARFEDDAAFYEPHLAFVTIGGNDSFAHSNVSPDQFRGRLCEIQQRFDAMGTCVVFQTYYAPDPDQLAEPPHKFYAFMDIVRQVAGDTGAALVDHLGRWEPFRQAYPDLYKPLMRDGFHLNRRGNAVVGVDLARCFGAALEDDGSGFWAEPLRIQRLMDELSGCP